MATLRQITANQQNALKSRGPTTERGKQASRANALTHGLAGAGVVLPDEEAEAVKVRMTEWRDRYQPTTVEDEWLFEQVVVNSVRLDHCRRLETELRVYQARRAALSWDDDRRLAAEETAATLAKDPSRTSRRLARTRQGCDWLLERWRGLGSVFERTGEWTEPQRALALDLLGTPAELRDGLPIADPPALVAREVARLEELQADRLDELDDYERSAAELGLEVEPSRPLSQLRRYEAACMRRFQWARTRLLQSNRSTDAPPPSAARPLPAPTPPPTPRTDADWRAYEANLFRDALARKAAQAASSPAPTSDFDPDPFGLLAEFEAASLAFSIGQTLPPLATPPVKVR